MASFLRFSFIIISPKLSAANFCFFLAAFPILNVGFYLKIFFAINSSSKPSCNKFVLVYLITISSNFIFLSISCFHFLILYLQSALGSVSIIAPLKSNRDTKKLIFITVCQDFSKFFSSGRVKPPVNPKPEISHNFDEYPPAKVMGIAGGIIGVGKK